MIVTELRSYEALRDALVEKAARRVAKDYGSVGVTVDDARQEIWVWLLAPSERDGLTGEDRVRRWLHGVPRQSTAAVSAMIHAVGREGYGRREASEARAMPPARVYELAEWRSRAQGRTAAPAEAGPAVREALGTLSPAQREAVVLHYLEGLSYTEVAERLGVRVRAVERRLYRARRVLADHGATVAEAGMRGWAA